MSPTVLWPWTPKVAKKAKRTKGTSIPIEGKVATQSKRALDEQNKQKVKKKVTATKKRLSARLRLR